jgi:hypothetical protein
MNFSAVNQNYVSEPINEYVIIGNDAIMKCSIPSFMSDFISVVGWTDNSGNEFHVQSQEHKPGTVACAVILATGTVDIGCLRW